MRVGDIMTRNVVAVPPDTPALAVARLLADRGISAVPVADSWSMLLGIVSEADLIRRLATEDTPEPAGLLRSLFYDRDCAAAQYARAHGATAQDLMTKDVVTATEGMSAEHAARLIEEHRVRRLPVVHDGMLVGIVSRADLLRALVAPRQAAEAALSDEEIRRAVLAAMREESTWADSFNTLVEVKEGVVTFHGFARGDAVRRALRVLAENIPGVKGVVDDTRPLPASPYMPM